MNAVMFVYAFLLFFVLTPGVLVTLPPKSGRLVVSLTHALVFAVIWTLTHKMVWQASTKVLFEGMTTANDPTHHSAKKEKEDNEVR